MYANALRISAHSRDPVLPPAPPAKGASQSPSLVLIMALYQYFRPVAPVAPSRRQGRVLALVRDIVTLH